MKPVQFLAGGGEMGERIRAYDWSSTSVGAIDAWPQSLKTTISIIINSNFPMFLWWGDDLIQFYNDAYRVILGTDGRHPMALGSTAEKCWTEVWSSIQPLIQRVLEGGESVYLEDQMFPLFRNGRLEEAYWTFGYSPVKDESGEIAGVMVICSETTNKIKDFKQIIESRDLLEFAIDAAELATWDLNPLTNKFTGNDRLKEWFGLSNDAEIPLQHAVDMISDKDRKLVADAILKATQYPGENYEIEYTIINPLTKKERIVAASGKAWFNQNKIAYRFNGILQDITHKNEKKLAEKKIIESEQRYRTLINSAPVAIGLFVGRDLVIENQNEIFNQIVGKGDVTGWRLIEAMPELVTEGQPFLQILDDVFTSGKMFQTFGTQVKIVQNGILTYNYYDFTYTPIFDSEGKVYAILDIAIDVTENVLAQKKIEENANNLKNTIEKAPVAMCIFKGSKHTIEIANDRMLEFWGKGSSEVIGKPLLEGFPEIKGQGFEELLDKVFETGETVNAYDVPAILPRKNTKEKVYVDFVYEAFREPDGTISGVMAVATDVTQQVLARKKIQEAEEKARLAIESADLGSYEVNLRTNEMKTSDRFDEIWGIKSVSRNQLANQIHPEDISIRDEAHLKSLETGFLDFETRVLHDENSVKWVRVKGKLLFDDNQVPKTLIGVVQDITEQKQFAEQLTKLVKERTLELHRSNEDLLQFAHVASHDLKEPVRKIKIFSSMLQSDFGNLLPDRGVTYLNKVQNATDRMFSMIEGVLAYSEFTSAAQKIDTIDLNSIIENIESDLELLIQKKDATIYKTLLPEIEGAEVLIHQLFYNLINNALKFSKNDIPSKIEIHASSAIVDDLEMVKITVSDNGIGLDPSLSEKIFDVFSRLNAKDDYEGTGLGLALCKKIVERHHGTISATGVKDERAIFTILLPKKQLDEII